MAGLKKSARKTMKTATEAVQTAAAAVAVGREAMRTARKAGSEARVVASKLVDRVTGRAAARRKKALAVAAGVASASVLAGVVVARTRKARKR
jgi:hypothetical protein